MTPIQKTFHAFQEASLDAGALWNIMLEHGLTWDNVWSVYTEGVYDTHADTKIPIPKESIPSVLPLVSLPEQPTTMLELFDCLERLCSSYPHAAMGVLNLDSVVKGVFPVLFEQCRFEWSSFIAVMQKTVDTTDARKSHILNYFIKAVCPVPCHAQAIECLITMEHSLIKSYPFGGMLKDFKVLPDALESMVLSKKWLNANNAWLVMKHIINDANHTNAASIFSFFEHYPQVVPYFTLFDIHLEHLVRKCSKNEILFNRGVCLLLDNPSAAIECHNNTKIPMSLATAQALVNPPESNVSLEMLLTMYEVVLIDQRNNAEGEKFFHKHFSRALSSNHFSIGAHNASTLLKSMALFVKHEPTGVVAALLALHACSFGRNGTRKEIDAYKSILHHDPSTKTGYAAIIKKYIPELKESLSMANHMDMTASQIWSYAVHCSLYKNKYETNANIEAFQVFEEIAHDFS